MQELSGIQPVAPEEPQPRMRKKAAKEVIDNHDQYEVCPYSTVLAVKKGLTAIIKVFDKPDAVSASDDESCRHN